MDVYDAIVIGVGGMGSAALCHLAQRGLKVLGIEPFGVPNDRGSSHGETRIIRKAYFEHPDYVPLLQKAYGLWRELETACGQELYRRTGLLEIGMPSGLLVDGVNLSVAVHRLPIEVIPVSEVSKRFPGFVAYEPMHALFEADAGFLHVERCVEAHAARGCALGATIVTGDPVRGWTADTTGVTVETERTTYSSGSLVFCAGPWTGKLMASLGLPLTVLRKPVLWYATRGRRYSLENGCPVFCFDTADGFFYGLPTVAGDYLKIAEHTGGEVAGSADELDRTLHPGDETRIARFVKTHLPDVIPRIGKFSVCMYTMTPDQHFIIDRHPEYGNVVFAAGFSGHGFKFAPVVGSVLADLVVSGHTAEPIGFLSAGRSALACR